MLQYQGSYWSAAQIASNLNSAAGFERNKRAFAIIATSVDINALVQLQIVLAQAQQIINRLTMTTTHAANIAIFPCYSTIHTRKPKPKPTAVKPRPSKAPPPPAAGSRLYALSPTDFQTLIQAAASLIPTIASVGAVNESSSASPGTLSDASLINLVASRLPRGQVFVPSAYPPNLVPSNQLQNVLSDSLIVMKINEIERDREALYDVADKRLNQKQCQQSSLNKSTLAQLANEVTAASTLVDSFETSLFSGMSASLNSNGANGAAKSPASPAPAASTQNGASNISLLPQLLYADYMLRQIEKKDGDYYFVALHSLESGGNSLTRSSIWGSRIYFSGGAVATFSLFMNDGKLLCSGISFGYRGFIQDKDITAALDETPDPSVSPQPGISSENDAGELLPRVSSLHAPSATSSCQRAAGT